VGVLLPRPWPSVLLVGPTGSGKTPLGQELERRGFLGRPCAHFDFGANLRAAATGEEESGLTPDELAAVRTSLATGALFEAKDIPMVVRILARFVESRRLGPGARLVLNGLPRHRQQAEALAGIIAVERVVSLEADAAVIRVRIRRDPGRDRSGREDDEEGAVVRRLASFRERTAPLIDFYRRQGVPVTAIPVGASMTAAAMADELDRLLPPE
jgi:adenylate kinase